MRKPKITCTRIIAFGFLALVAAGTLLLSLPAAAKGGKTSFVDCLFTATSAVCVTGLVPFDTATHWSLFGQTVILLLIQIGGLGVMTVISLFFLAARKRFTLGERVILMQSAGGLVRSGVVRVIKTALIGTFAVEGVGALLLFLRFLRDMPPARALYAAVFHAVSAFCNAGFDVLGDGRSFESYRGDVFINAVLMVLIVAGGLGFFVWLNVFSAKFRPSGFELHTKAVLASTAFLLLSGTLLFYIFERNSAFSGMSEGQKWLSAAFQSVTTRTAGFATVDQATLCESGTVLSAVFMLIGGSPGSTAGGIKTTTVAVLLAATVSCARNRGSTVLFKKKVDDGIVRQATAIIIIYVSAVIAGTAVLCAIEPLSLGDALFETVSAIATVGLTRGVTPSLGVISKLILTFLMYAGRLGGLSLVIALAEKRNPAPVDRPDGKIMIG